MAELFDLSFSELSARQIYDILRLRTEIFAVEQNVAYQDMDYRDCEPATRHIWWDEKGRVLSYMRLLTEPTGALVVGRVVTDLDERNNGYASRLMDYVIDKYGDRKLEMRAQAYLEDYYSRWGFVPTGPEFIEEERAHIPMERLPS